MAAKLTHGDWVMFESPEPNVQLFWDGRSVSKAEWQNSCTYQNGTRARQMMMSGSVPLNPGEYAINVQWYTIRDAAIPLEYIMWDADPHPFVNHYSMLVLGRFEMVQIVGNSVRVPRQRRTVQQRNDDFGYAHPQFNLQTREGDWVRSEFGNIYKMDEATRDVGIARCGCTIWNVEADS